MNRPFLSSLVPLFQNESKCKTRSNENEFDLHENELVGGTHFHMNGFALRLVLTRRQKGLGHGLFATKLSCGIPSLSGYFQPRSRRS